MKRVLFKNINKIKFEMYIGPWQEYKLAKILAMKAKLEKEQLAEPETAPTSSKNIVAS